MIQTRKKLIGSLLGVSGVLVGSLFFPTTAPVPSALSSRGVRDRPVGQRALSSAVDSMELLRERTYRGLSRQLPFVLEAARRHRIPANVLMAILFEEGIHRKPVDISTFGPAQIGLGELIAQGLPPRVDLLEDPEISVFILAAKLSRLQRETGSLRDAIILHSGYTDYLELIRQRANDPRIHEILEMNIVRKEIEV